MHMIKSTQFLGGLSFGDLLSLLDTVNVININDIDENLMVTHAERKLNSFNPIEMITVLKKIPIIPLSSRTQGKDVTSLGSESIQLEPVIEYIQCPYCRNFHKKIKKST